MKGFLCFLVAVTIAVMVYAAPDCPPFDPILGAAHLPNPANCSTFFQCSETGPVLLECMEGTWFNPLIWVCDWPANVPEGVCTPP